MKRIIVNMQNFIFTDAIGRALMQNGDGLDVINVEKTDSIIETSNIVLPYAAIMEVTDFSPYTFEERMAIRDELSCKHPMCKIVFVCNDKSESKVAKQVKQAKIDGLIDQFIYDSITATYMAALVDSL